MFTQNNAQNHYSDRNMFRKGKKISKDTKEISFPEEFWSPWAQIYYNVNIYTIILLILLKYVCLSVLANGRSQFLLDHLGRCLKLFVSTESTSCHEFVSQFGLEFFLSEKHPNYREYCVAHATVYLNEAATGHLKPSKRGR